MSAVGWQVRVKGSCFTVKLQFIFQVQSVLPPQSQQDLKPTTSASLLPVVMAELTVFMNAFQHWATKPKD